MLWHERDISHSSAERIVLPDATGLLAFMLRDLSWVMDGLVIFRDRMRAQVDVLGGIAFSQRVLLSLVDAGRSRDDAYRIVQRAAAAAWDEGASFRAAIEADPEAAGIDLDPLFDPTRFLSNLGPLFDRLEKLPVEVPGG